MLSEKRKMELSELAEFIGTSYSVNSYIELTDILKENNISYNYGYYEDFFDGLIEFENNKFHIYVNLDKVKNEISSRARFTLAHELGHFFIDEHRNALKSGKSTFHKSFTEHSSNEIIEQEADYFASCLLMPSEMFRNYCAKQKFSIGLIKKLSDTFATSYTSTLLRYFELDLYPIFITFIKNKEVTWYRGSHDFPYKYTLIQGKQIPEFTIAHEYLTHGTKYDEPLPIDITLWFKDYDIFKSSIGRDFFEECFFADYYNFFISAIWEE